MGYKINSTWTQLRADDIKKLNEIIDDEYCIEKEIGLKLNIMNKFEELFSKAIEEINWNGIIKFMEANNWEWAFYDNGLNYRVPTKTEMINRLREDFLKPGLYKIIEVGEKKYSSYSGGFVIEMGHEGDNFWLNIYFDIANFYEEI